MIYNILPVDDHSSSIDNFVFYQLNLALILLVIVYEYIRIALIQKKINSEDWLPVVNETGQVTGRVAFSVSRTSKKSYLHPNVRVALIYKGMFYLMDRPSHYLLDPGKIDYPFEEYVRYKQSLDDAVKGILERRCGTADLPVKFVFRYLFKNSLSFRLVYLFTINITDEDVMNKLRFSGGKLWTEKQIEENLGTGLFSECFEKEYEILKNTVLMSLHLINEMTDNLPVEMSNDQLGNDERAQ